MVGGPMWGTVVLGGMPDVVPRQRVWQHKVWCALHGLCVQKERRDNWQWSAVVKLCDYGFNFWKRNMYI